MGVETYTSPMSRASAACWIGGLASTGAGVEVLDGAPGEATREPSAVAESAAFFCWRFLSYKRRGTERDIQSAHSYDKSYQGLCSCGFCCPVLFRHSNDEQRIVMNLEECKERVHKRVNTAASCNVPNTAILLMLLQRGLAVTTAHALPVQHLFIKEQHLQELLVYENEVAMRAIVINSHSNIYIITGP